MITLFHMLQVAGVVAGALVGGRAGVDVAGTAGGISGGFVGAAVGWVVGRLPFVLGMGWVHCGLRRSSTPDLRAQLESDYYVSHLIIAELTARGEPLESVRRVVVAQLTSPSAHERTFGEANARVWFPDLLREPPPNAPGPATG